MWLWLHRLASPPGFAAFARLAAPTLAWLWALFYVLGVAWCLTQAPADYQQGDAYRIIFIHVPAAWMSMFVYVCMTAAAAVGLVWNLKLAPVFVCAAAPLGAGFTLLTLFTGSVWGKPMWGAWWVWDARLTSELLLFFLYLGLIALHNALPNRRVAARAVAIWLLASCGIVPIIHFSVKWWNTLHQPASIMKLGAPSLHAAMLYPLLWMAVCFMLFFAAAVLWGMQAELLRRAGGGQGATGAGA